MNVTTIGTDPDALESFYREHVWAVQRFVARRVSDPHVAADLTADVFQDFRLVMGSNVPEGFTVDISHAPEAGETLVIGSTLGLPDIDDAHPRANQTWIGLVTGDVPACVPVEAPSKR